VLGIRPEDIRVVTADTDLTPVDLGSYSSRVTLMTGNAAKEAAEKLRGQLLDAAAKRLEVSPAALDARDRRIVVRDDPSRGLAFDEAARLAEAVTGTLVAAGSYTPPKRAARYKGAGVGPTPAYSYSACVVELEVDPATADIRIDRIWIAHDGGTAINPLLVEGQVEGSIYMGLGEALMEEQVFRHGLHKIPSMLEYKSPTTLETPEITTLLVQTHDPEGPFGAKEAGQGPLLPVIPAIANAVYDAIGVRIDEVPITPEKILKALDQRARGRPARVGPERLPDVRFPEPIRVPPPWVDPEGRAATAVHGRETPRP
jgi:CO/xanthine dehydrogenase Mo-binding subunit